MSLRVQGNVNALNAARHVTLASAVGTRAMERLSSGYRINRASDDAAGLVMSERLRSQSRGLAQAQRNIQDGISLIQTAEGTLNEAHGMLQRLRELTIQVRNGTQQFGDRINTVVEMQNLLNELIKTGQRSRFNGVYLGGGATLDIQVGARDSEKITVDVMDLVGTVTDTYFLLSDSVLAQFDSKIDAISAGRAKLGAQQNRLEHALSSAAVAQENLLSADSRIRDADFAVEMVAFTKQQILGESGRAMLAHSMQAPRNVLSLLTG